MKCLLPLAALLLAAGCNPAISPLAQTPTFSESDLQDMKTLATIGEGGAVKITSANTKITFTGTKPDGGKGTGGFKTVEGLIRRLTLSPGMPPPPADQAQVINITADVEAESLWADDLKLADQLKGPDFLDVKKFPKISFKSTKIVGEPSKNEDATVTGSLTLHGVTKPVTFPVHFTLHKWSFVLTGSFKINRKDFGITSGDGQWGDEVTVDLTVGNLKDRTK
jgi:polyisoprenoid-binding protein YceI